jgi:hypothetical protein
MLAAFWVAPLQCITPGLKSTTLKLETGALRRCFTPRLFRDPIYALLLRAWRAADRKWAVKEGLEPGPGWNFIRPITDIATESRFYTFRQCHRKPSTVAGALRDWHTFCSTQITPADRVDRSDRSRFKVEPDDALPRIHAEVHWSMTEDQPVFYLRKRRGDSSRLLPPRPLRARSSLPGSETIPIHAWVNGRKHLVLFEVSLILWSRRRYVADR